MVESITKDPMPEDKDGVEQARLDMEGAVKERGERFPEVDVALKALEAAAAKMETFVADLRQSAKDLPWMRDNAAAKVMDWAGNLVPGVQTAKELSDWVRINLGGSLKYAAPPYQPTSFAQVRERLVALAAMEKAAVELKLADALGTHQRAVASAEAALQKSFEGMNLADQLALAELQQKILELRDKAFA